MIALLLATVLTQAPTSPQPAPARQSLPAAMWSCPEARADLLARGTTQKSFGAPLLVSGALGVVGGVVGLVLAEDQRPVMGVVAGVSAALAVIGTQLLWYGGVNTRESLTLGCAAILKGL